MKVFTLLLACSALGLVAAANVDLQAKYPFSAVLYDQNGQYYSLHWNFTRSTESIYFAVNVSTTGWVGFGLSPNGQMPGSDVVMGWVAGSGEAFFQDRFAQGRFLPPIDTVSQDWFLTNSVEENGFTLLEFSRNFTSCDPQDLNVTPDTARVVWSFSTTDPTDPLGSDARQHDYQGSRSINLLGGLPGDTSAPTGPSFDVAVTDVVIPSDDTTYWCATFRLPQELIDRTHYITRISPVITPHDRPFVHHVLVYLCRDPLIDGEVGQSGACHQLNDNINSCRQGLLVGAWAVGGEDFIYPEGIAYPVGGAGQEQFALIEMHYDNPTNVQGELDSSGLRFFYSTEARAQDAGIMYLGHSVTRSMVVPPRTENFAIAGVCTADCTGNIPPEGIRIFADVLHTHLIGRAVTIQHLRYNTECNVWEELEPIDQNLNYDFNFQQFTQLPREHVVLPGDVLVVLCNYSSAANAEIVQGGESTNEEMCLSFPVFYPRAADGSSLVVCASLPSQTSFTNFVTDLFEIDPAAAQGITDEPSFYSTLNNLDWQGNPQLARSLQDSVLQSSIFGLCVTESGQFGGNITSIPDVSCPYEAPDRCSGEQPLSCCDRVTSPPGPSPTAGALRLEISMGVGSFLLLLSLLMA